MITEYLNQQTKAIVFVGDFNPVIVQPTWLSMKRLIREGEASAANIEIIHNELSRFQIRWVNFEITPQRFEISTSLEEYFEPLKDLATSIFEILKETPIRMLGINHVSLYSYPSYESYYELGNKLCPLSNWGNSLPDPRLLQVEVTSEIPDPQTTNRIRVRVAGVSIPNVPHGVEIRINDHYEIHQEMPSRAEFILDVLRNNWDKSHSNSQKIIQNI